MGGGVTLVQVDIGRLDCEHAAVRHGVPCIDAEIQNDLADLTLVRLDAPQLWSRLHVNFKMLTDQPAKQTCHFSNDRVQLKNARLENLTAAEGKELLGQICSPLGRLFDLSKILSGRIAGWQPIQQNRGIAEDRSEQIVKVMSHPTGKLSHGLHFARLG